MRMLHRVMKITGAGSSIFPKIDKPMVSDHLPTDPLHLRALPHDSNSRKWFRNNPTDCP
jgi:hypothetical protein